MMTYKGYAGQVQFDDKADIFHGRVIGIKDVITFEGVSVDEIRQAFRDSVDDYLELCKEIGSEPEKPFSGKLPFRTTPERHRRIYIAAQLAGKSINAWMDDALVEAASRVRWDRSISDDGAESVSGATIEEGLSAEQAKEWATRLWGG